TPLHSIRYFNQLILIKRLFIYPEIFDLDNTSSDYRYWWVIYYLQIKNNIMKKILFILSLFVISGILISATLSDKKAKTETETTSLETSAEVEADVAVGPPCKCYYSITHSGISSFVIYSNGSPHKTFSGLGSYSGSTTLSAPYTYDLHLESLSGGSATILWQACNVSTENYSGTMNIGDNFLDSYSTSGCASSCSPAF
ncbi:MAG: hypothetical protein AAFZ15_02665, partial [Bacteroidota bacterium]